MPAPELFETVTGIVGKHRISNNVGQCNYFLGAPSRALRKARHSALSGSFCPCHTNQGLPVIGFRPETQFDPYISSVTLSIMNASSKERQPIGFLPRIYHFRTFPIRWACFCNLNDVMASMPFSLSTSWPRVTQPFSIPRSLVIILLTLRSQDNLGNRDRSIPYI